MKKITLIVMMLIACVQLSFSQQNYKRVTINNVNESTIHVLQDIGLDLTCGVTFKNNQITLELFDYELEKLENEGISYSVIINNMQKFYSERATADAPKALAELEYEKSLSAQKSFSVNEIINNTGQYNECDEIDWAVPVNWNLNPFLGDGIPSTDDFGGCLTYDMVLQELDDMRALYPSLVSAKLDMSVTPSDTGVETTAGGRTVYYVRISDNPDTDEAGEPETLYQSLIHSREAATVMNQLYFMWYILENYSTDTAIQNLVNNQALYFVPVFNPDGFVYNENQAPNGGGGQRKNRNTSGGCGTYDDGIDLNRNSGYYWGNGGSSTTDNCSAIYAGSAPFSEVETQIMRDFFLDHDFELALNHHSFKNAMLHAYAGVGHIANPRPDEYSKYNHDMTYYNRYAHGPSTSISGLNSGNMNDWMLGGPSGTNPSNGVSSGGTGSGKNTMAWTPENGLSSEGTGGTYGGFWPASSNYLPIAKRAMRMNFLAAYFSGKYGKVHDLNQHDITATSGNLSFAIENLGQQASDFTVTVTAVSNITIPGATNSAMESFTAAEVLDQRTVNIPYTLPGGIQADDEIEFKVVFTNNYASDNVLYEANIKKTYTPNVLVTANVDPTDLSGWTSSGLWTTTTDAFSGSRAYKSNSTTIYAANQNQTLQLNGSQDFTNIETALIQYHAKWDLERSYDYVVIEGSTDGSSWTELCGKLTKPGAPTANNSYSSTNDAGDNTFKSSADDAVQNGITSLYDGDTQDRWNMEEVVIDATTNSFLYKQGTVFLRFRLRTDSSNRKDSYANADFEGFTFDNFKIIEVKVPCDNTNPPTNLTVDLVTPLSASVSWDAIPSATYDIRYRQIGAPSWTEVTDIATNSYIISSLTEATNYEFQVSTRCATNTSSYSTSENFTTTSSVACTGTTISSYPYAESFETGISPWTQDNTEDFDWTRKQEEGDGNSTTSGSTGPADAGDGQWFLYTEASNPNFPSRIARLISPCFDFTGFENAMFSFDYHMYGAFMGVLTVDVSTDNGTSYTTIAASTLDGQQQSSHAEAWKTQIVDLSAFSGQSIKLRFTGTTDSNASNGWQGDMAIDNFSLTADVATGSAPPVAVCQNITVQLDASGNATIVATDVDGGSTDDVAITNYSIDIDTFDCSNIGTPVNVTLTVTDGDSQTDTCVAAVTITQQDAPTPVNCWDNFVYNTTTCVWDNTGSQPSEPPVVNCWDNFVFNTTTCVWDNTGSQPSEPPVVNCWDNFVFNTTTCVWDNTGSQPSEPPVVNCWDNFVFNTTTCVWDNTGSQPSEPPVVNCWDNFVFNTTTCVWDNTGSQPSEPPVVNCWDNFVFNTTTCVWDNTGSQPSEPPVVNCWDNFVFNTTTCVWDNTGSQPSEPPVVNCWDNFVFNTTTCVWDNTGSQPSEPPVVNCWDNFVFNTTTCVWDNTGSQPSEPPVVNCWDNFVFNTTTCVWDNTGSQPSEPPVVNCWDNFVFNTTTCVWDNTGSQPSEPPVVNCWDNFVFNTTTCVWDNTGSQPSEPPVVNCWDNFVFNTTTCVWDNTGSQPSEPPVVNCWDNFVFNTTTCVWDNTGSQPSEPPVVNCWDNFVFNTTTCVWDNTGSQPSEPPVVNCWDNFVFNTTTCVWDNTGSQPSEPPVVNCWDNFVFNTTTCVWDNTGSQPSEPPVVNCWDNFVFNTTTCVWDNTGSQPSEPPVVNCWDNFVFNTTTCVWDNTGSQPSEPPVVNCWDNFVFNTTTCVWDNTGSQPSEPPVVNCWDNFVFNTTTCVWDNTGSQPSEPPVVNCWDNFVFNTTTCVWDNTGSQPSEPPVVNCWDNFVFNTTTCVWDNTGSQPSEPPVVNCWDNFVFNTTTCVWDNTGSQPSEPPVVNCWDNFVFNTTTCVWDNTGSQPSEPPVVNCWDNFVFNTTTCVWDNTGSQPSEPPVVNCWDNFVFNTTTCVWDNTGSQPSEPPVVNCWDNFVFNTTTCVWDNTGSNLPPVAICQDITVQLDGSGNATITATDIDNGSSDNCFIDTMSVSPSTFNTSNIGANTVTLTVTDSDGNVTTCDATVTVEEDTLTLPEFNSNNVLITPNPFGSYIDIHLPLNFNNSDFTIKIYDLNGRIVYNNRMTSSDGMLKVNGLENLEEAPYFIKVTHVSGGQTIYKKLIKHE